MKVQLFQRKGLFFVCAVFILVFAASGYSQERFPSRPITCIIPSSPGSTVDMIYRVICSEAQKILGQPIVPLNRAGGSMSVGIAALAASKPDGYTIGHTGHPGMFFTPFLEKVPYHPVKDLKQIMQFGLIQVPVVVRSDSPFKTSRDMVAYARQNPYKMTYATTGGSMGSLAMTEIAKKEAIQFTEIPFKGVPEMETALLGGHVMVATTGGLNFPLLEAGKIRVLFLIAEERFKELPEVPTLKDLGYDIPAPLFLSIAGPKDIPEPIAKRLEEAFTQAMKQEPFLRGMKELHLTVFYRNSKDVTNYVARNYELLGKLMREVQPVK
jgi:tripartite-type tricarboxylate transporter receptor subunit TctC